MSDVRSGPPTLQYAGPSKFKLKKASYALAKDGREFQQQQSAKRKAVISNNIQSSIKSARNPSTVDAFKQWRTPSFGATRPTVNSTQFQHHLFAANQAANGLTSPLTSLSGAKTTLNGTRS